MNLGTILPKPRTEALADAVFEKNRRDNDAYAAQHFAHCTLRVVGVEKRYYRTPTTYATIAGQQRVRWFEHRADGEYSIKAPDA